MKNNRSRQNPGKRRKKASPTPAIGQANASTDATWSTQSSSSREGSAIASLSGMALAIITLSINEASALEHSHSLQVLPGDASLGSNRFIEPIGLHTAIDWQHIEIVRGKDARLPQLTPRQFQNDKGAESRDIEQGVPLQDHVVLLGPQEHGNSPVAGAARSTILTAGDTATVPLANGLKLKLTLASASAQAEAEPEIILRDEPFDTRNFGQLNPNLLIEEEEEQQDSMLPPFNTDILKGGWLTVDFSEFAGAARTNASAGGHLVPLNEVRDESLSNDEDASIVATYDASGPFSG
jgi:hypothetical protein